MANVPPATEVLSDRRSKIERQYRNSLFVMLQGPAVGQIFPLFLDEMTIGRDKQANICLDDASVSRLHARIRNSGESIELTDLGSTNGTWVNGENCAQRTLKDQDHVQIGSSVAKFVSAASTEQPYYEEAYRQAYMDKVLLVYNKHYCLQRLDEELLRCRHDGLTLSLLIFDADHFKKLNDTYGHLAGDAALVHLMSIVKSHTRSTDALCRYGGEEFALILPDTGLSTAYAVAEHIRSRVAKTPLEFFDQTISVTISTGVASFVPSEAKNLIDRESLIQEADHALYLAKLGGRNRTVAAKEIQAL